MDSELARPATGVDYPSRTELQPSGAFARRTLAASPATTATSPQPQHVVGAAANRIALRCGFARCVEVRYVARVVG